MDRDGSGSASLATTSLADDERCLDENTVQAVVESTASPEELARVERHVDRCSACRVRLATMGLVLASGEVLRSTTAVEPAEPIELQDGALVGRYTIRGAIGAGAMGVVFVAHDPDLDRRIALKLVRATTDGGSDGRRARVLREAKANARLAHPNVVAVHDVGTYGDHVFIAMELVEGGTLRDAFDARRPWREILQLFLMAGDGLAAAHEGGLVHRDFKPDNVLLGLDGRARVADFGLARGIDANEPDVEPLGHFARLGATLTQTGTVLGTPAYMAPEQMRGERADARADVFAFCVSLFEGLYGGRPFGGRSLAELRASIEEGRVREPDHDEAFAARGIPATVQAAIMRGIRANADERWPSMAALLVELRHDETTKSAPPAAPPKPSRIRAGFAIALAAVSIAAAAVGTFAWRSRAHGSSGSAAAVGPPMDPPDPPFTPSTFRRITFDEGCEEFPSFTPDGQSIVFDASDGADSALFQLSLATMERRRLTRVHGWDFASSVSPDGKRVAFLRSSSEQSGAFVVPFDATPDVAPQFVVHGGTRPSWSPDSRAIWAGEKTSYALHAVDDGKVLRELPVPAGYIAGQSVELEDGRLAVTFPFLGSAANGAVGVYSADGQLQKLYDGNVGEVLALLPGTPERILAVHKMDNLVPALMALRLDGRATTSLAQSGVLARKGLTISPDGRKLVYSTCRSVNNLFRFTADGRAEALGPDPEWDEQDVAALPGSNAVVVLSERSGEPQPWIVERNGNTTSRPINTFDEVLQDVSVSPDGRWLVGMTTEAHAIGAQSPDASFEPATLGLYVMDTLEELKPRALTSGASDQDAAFDAKGENVLFTRIHANGTREVMIVPAAGGEPRPYLGLGSSAPSVSPADGRVVYLQGEASESVVPMVFDPRSGTRAPLSKALVAGNLKRPQYSADGKRVAVIRAGLEVVEVDTGAGVILRTLSHNGDTIERAVYSGADIIVLRAGWTGDLWSADLTP